MSVLCDVWMPGVGDPEEPAVNAMECWRLTPVQGRPAPRWAPGGGTVRRAHHEYRREYAKAGVEQRILRVQVAADDIGQIAVSSVADHRHLPPGWHLQDAGHRDKIGIAHAAHAVLVAVRKHDDVAAARPMLITGVNGDPARAACNDVKQDDAVRVWAEDFRRFFRG